MNSLNLRQVCGGDTIKQADFGSELAFELLNEQYDKIIEPLGELAKVILKKDNIAIYQTSVAIIDNIVSFKFDKILPVGSYILEIIVGDYVFPSNNLVIITVEQTHGDFEPEYLVKVSYEELKADVDDFKIKIEQFENALSANEINVNQELLVINQNVSDMNTRIESLENREDNDTIYDDTSIKQSISDVDIKVDNLSVKVTELEQRPSSEPYDDTELSNRVTALEQKEDKDTIYDDTEIKQSIAKVDNKMSGLSEKVTALEERPTVDTALTERVEALERKEDKDTVYDDTAIKKELNELNQSVAKKKLYYAYANDENGVDSFIKADVYDSFYRDLYPYFGISDKDSDNPNDYIWMPARLAPNYKLDGAIIEVNRLKALHEVRRAPTGYTLDRTTTPWTVWFDNGCGLQMSEYGTTATVYGYGFSASYIDNSIVTFPIIPNIIRVSNGSLTIEKIKTLKGYANYWSPSIKIINPIRDRDDYDWVNARFNPESLSDNHYSFVRQQYFIRTMYELGIWSGEIVEEFGATKK